MIQRIQSLLLFVAAACFAVACFMPVGTFIANDTYYLVTSWSANVNIPNGEIIYPTYFVGLLQVLLAGLSLVTIFLYKKRMLQSRLCLAGMFLSFILLAIMLWIYPDFILPKVFGVSKLELQYSLFPLLSIVPLACFYFANKCILNDEKKVRAADRLR